MLEISKWTKQMLNKACKAFEINHAGFEHEIMDLILRMDEKRPAQIQNRNGSSSEKKKGKKKGENEVLNLICGVNYGGSSRKERGRRGKEVKR